MRRYKITHRTTYEFRGPAQLLPHSLRLRPREGHELRIETSKLSVSPEALLRWHRDVEGNSVATAEFKGETQKLEVISEVVIQQYDLSPENFLVDDYAVDYPFVYQDEDKMLLLPYMKREQEAENELITSWVNQLWKAGEPIQTFALLLRLNQSIFQKINYRRREEEGVQSADYTLACGSGSCRDVASLYMSVARQLGFAARFVSGYLYSKLPEGQAGSTHAWAEIFIPGAGWKGFDPAIGNIAGPDHIATAVARLPEAVPPIEGGFFGARGAEMSVNVLVEKII